MAGDALNVACEPTSGQNPPVLCGTGSVCVMKSYLGERSTIGTCLFKKKLCCRVPLGLFNLPLPEALKRGACVSEEILSFFVKEETNTGFPRGRCVYSTPLSVSCRLTPLEASKKNTRHQEHACSLMTFCH